jgi:hypothetical protein
MICALAAVVSILLAATNQQCVSVLRKDGVTKLVGVKLFANGSLGVIDAFAKYYIFESTGSLHYSETLNLPVDASTGEFRKVAAGIIGNASEIYVLTTYERSYKYSAGAIEPSSNYLYLAGGSKRLMIYNFIVSLPDLFIQMFNDKLNIYQVEQSTGKLKMFTATSAYTLTTQTVLDFAYFSRLSTNPISREWAAASTSTKIYIGGFAWDAVNNVFGHSPTSAGVLSNVITDSSAWVISGSVGLSPSYYSYVRLIRLPPTYRDFSQELVVSERPPGTASASLLLKGYYVDSTAIHPTLNKVYLYTTHGDLYTVTFTTGPLTLQAPVLVASGLFIRFADLEVYDPTTMIIRNFDSLATFDLTTDTLKAIMYAKPAFGRDIPGQTKMLLVYQNLYAKLYDVNTHQIDTSFTFTGKVREIIVNQDVAKPRFYLLTDNDLRTFTYSGAISQVAVITKAQVLSNLGGVGCISIYSMNDIDISKYFPTTLLLLVFCQLTGSEASVIVSLNEQTLSYQTAVKLTNDQHCLLITSAKRSAANNEYVSIVSIDNMYFFSMTTATTLGTTPTHLDKYLLTTPAGTNIPLMPSFVKSSSRKIASPSKTFTLISFRFATEYIELFTANNSFVRYGTANSNPLISQYGIMDSLTGNLAQHRVFNKHFGMNVLWATSSSASQIISDSIQGGVAYQSPADGNVYITDGSQSLTMLSRSDCYSSNTMADSLMSVPYCTVASCSECSLFDFTFCRVCTAPKLVSLTGTACLSSCNPNFNYSNACTARCPIDTLHYSSTWNCTTESDCTTTYSAKVLGDRCVASCPAGGTVNGSNYCVAPVNKAISWTSGIYVNYPCTGGEKYWYHYRECINTAQLPTTGYTQSATSVYCDGSTHFFDVDSQRCLTTCTLTQGTDATIGKFCSSAATCTTTLAKYVDNTASPVGCVSSCQAGQWTDMVSKECVASCPGGTLSVISTKTCVAACPGGTYALSTNSSCLTSPECLAASLLVAPSTSECSATCSAGLYLYAASSSCYTAVECNAVAGSTGKITPSTMVCSTTCQAGLYNLATSSKCLTSGECIATPGANGGGLLSVNDLKCVSACGAGQYKLASTSQCLNGPACLASNSNTGLLSEADGMCVTSCSGSQYFKQATSQCLTAADCQASSGNTGLLSQFDRLCLTACAANQYLSSSTKECLLNTECWANSKMTTPSTSTCVSSCLASLYQDNLNQNCFTSSECVAAGKLTRAGSPGQCIPTCLPTEYLDAAGSACRTNLECNSVGKNVENNTMVCQNPCPGTYPFSYQGQCYPTCPLIVEEHDNSCVPYCIEAVTADGQYCQRSVTVTFQSAQEVAKNELEIRVSVSFTNTLNADPPYPLSGNWEASIASITVEDSSTTPATSHSCTLMLGSVTYQSSVVSLHVNCGSDPNLKFDSFTLVWANGQVIRANGYRGLLSVLNTKGAVTRMPPPPPPPTSGGNSSSGGTIESGGSSNQNPGTTNNSGESKPGNTKKESNEERYIDLERLSNATFVSGGVVLGATPFIMSSMLDLKSGSLLSFAAQTYLKLTLMTHMNFTLPPGATSSIYYNTFKEFFDRYNEELLERTIGSSMANRPKKTVCDHGFEKYCQVETGDSILLSKTIDLLILAASALVLLLLISIFKVIKRDKWKDSLKDNLKNMLVYAFIVDNNMSLWFELWLNVSIQDYSHPLFAFLKVLGYLCLPVYLVLFTFLVFPIKLKKGKIRSLVDTLRNNFRKIYEEISVKDASTKMMRFFLIHDLAFSACLMLSKVAGKYQLAIWLAAELGAISFIILNMKSFSNKSLFIRQLIAETGFLFLTASMISTHFTFAAEIPGTVLYGSMLLLWSDISFCTGYTIWDVVQKLKRARIGHLTKLKLGSVLPLESSSQPKIKLQAKSVSENLENQDAENVSSPFRITKIGGDNIKATGDVKKIMKDVPLLVKKVRKGNRSSINSELSKDKPQFAMKDSSGMFSPVKKGKKGSGVNH